MRCATTAVVPDPKNGSSTMSPGLREQLDEPLGQRLRKHGAVAFVAALGCEMQNIVGIHQLTADPIGNILAEATADC